MDQLDQYLQQLIATSASELHLVPNSVPYVVSASGNTDVDRVALAGSQISMMVFPLIPAEIKQELPDQTSVQFVHPSNFGAFDFTVEKTAAGFSVTIRPVSGTAKSAPPAPVVPTCSQYWPTPDPGVHVNVCADEDSVPVGVMIAAMSARV